MTLITLTPKEQRLNQLNVYVSEPELATHLNVRTADISNTIRHNWDKLSEEDIPSIKFIHNTVQDKTIFSINLTTALWVTELIDKSQRPTLIDYILNKMITPIEEQIQSLNKELLYLKQTQACND